MRLEAIALIDLDEARIGQEHRLVPKRLDRLGDADGIERGAEGRFGKEGEGFLGHGSTPGSNR